jgi:tRNA-dihydrouridine synthase B
VPVTLKMRTGCDTERNAVALARRAQDAGIALVTVHGRTRAAGLHAAWPSTTPWPR